MTVSHNHVSIPMRRRLLTFTNFLVFPLLSVAVTQMSFQVIVIWLSTFTSVPLRSSCMNKCSRYQ